MAEYLQDPDILGALITALKSRLNPIAVVNRVPRERPKKFVRLELFGGAGRADAYVTTRHTISYEAWAASPSDAAKLAHVTQAHLHSLARSTVGGVRVYQVKEVAAPGDLPDPDSRQERYVGSVEVRARLTTST